MLKKLVFSATSRFRLSFKQTGEFEGMSYSSQATSFTTNNIMDGNAVAKWVIRSNGLPLLIVQRSIRDKVALRIKTLQERSPRFQPQLAIIQAGDRPDSSVYVRMKAKAAEEIGIKFRHINLPHDAEVAKVIDVIQQLNEDDSVSGILVQLPLGEHVTKEDERMVTEAVSCEKDVDGYVSYDYCAI